MANRPNFLDLRSQSHGPLGSGPLSARTLPSPRLRIAGEVPPELSPLDAFAAQSRLLAKQLDESNRSGRRISRLPPLTIANTLQNRPGYFRSASAEAAPDSPISPGSALKTEVENPSGFRPASVYPQVGGATSLPSAPTTRSQLHDEEGPRGRRPPNTAEGRNFFDGRREQSPVAMEQEHRFSRRGNSPSRIHPRPGFDSVRQRAQGARRPEGTLAITGYDSTALAPPRSPFSQRTPSPRSISEFSDHEYAASIGIRNISPHRKPSTGSGLSTSPIYPEMYGMRVARSPSISSEISIGGTRLPRPAFNFSRPLSRASTSGLSNDYPTRQASSDSQPSFILADDTANTPVSMHGEGFQDNQNANGPAPSYVYSKFSLPRGKMLQRNSLIFQENLPQAQFSWEQPVSFSNVQSFNGAAPPSPPLRPSTASRPENNQSLDPGRPSLDPGRSSYDRARPSTEQGPRVSRFSEDLRRPSSPSAASSSTSTIKGRPQHLLAPSADMDAEEHVSKAIEFHEAGALTKSTYHLRLAARQNHPTGMLLYALACRHGWGMRPNQKEGVAWLRKAADSASLEVVDHNILDKDGNAVLDPQKKTRQAQFALSIYELGVSHMNGWGIEQDKVLALRCFEIAGCKFLHDSIMSKY